MSRISILDKDRCQPKKCDYLCISYCPGVRMDEDTIVIQYTDLVKTSLNCLDFQV